MANRLSVMSRMRPTAPVEEREWGARQGFVRAIALTIVLWVLVAVGQSIVHALIPGVAHQASFILVLLHILMAIAVMGTQLRGYFAVVGVGALLSRAALALADRYTSFELPFDGGDAEGFFRTAIRISEDVSLAGDTYGGVFTGFWGLVFSATGPERLLGQYTNVLCGVAAVLFTGAAVRAAGVEQRTAKIVMGVAAFAPTAIVFSSGFLREAPIQFLIAASLVAFLEGLLKQRPWFTLLALLLVLGASTLHAGVMGVAVGYAVVMAFVRMDPRRNALTFGFQGLLPTVVLLSMVGAFALSNPDLFLGKFSAFESAEEVIGVTNSRRGGSTYLTNLEVTGVGSLLLFSPIRMVYFYLSPLPLDWRGALDVASFLLDSSIFLISIGAGLMAMRRREHRVLVVGLLVVVAAVGLIFGIGVSNSGTAMRHRFKLLALVLTVAAVSVDVLRRTRRQAAKKPAR